MSSLRQNILSKSKKKSKLLSPSFLADTDTKEVEVRVMTVGERSDVVAKSNASGERDSAVYLARIVIESCYVPGTEDKVFTPADQDVLVALPSDVLDEIAAPALEINGLLLASLPVTEKN